ncbi:DNA mismatch repair protein MutS [Oxalobacteraceae bacterium]|nr:DNA mismatch repair protein MutS [Oxalobacteraceae bacterium]
MLSALNKWLRAESAEVLDFPFAPSDVARYAALRPAADGPALDAQTWNDMLLAEYSAQLGQGSSIVGQQVLHRRLMGGRTSTAACVGVQALAQDAARRDSLQLACRGMRQADSEISAKLFGAEWAPAPRWAAALGWLAPAFLLTAVLALASGWVVLWLAVLGLWLLLMGIQVRFFEAAEQWERTLLTLRQVLGSHALLAQLDDPLTQDLRADSAQAGTLRRALSRSTLDQVLPGAREYADWLWLKNIRHYFASRDLVLLQRAWLGSSFERVGRVEADLALARHLAQTGRYCWPERGEALRFGGVVHPLLAQAAPLSFALDARGAFISGQNGIGKSTLLRTLGINLITARAFGFCYADTASTPLLPVYSSMQGEDSLASGESLYIAELRRAQELLALAERAPALFIIDEIFRGTNHLESISAAAAVLHTLAASGRVIVSSHNLVLAPLLADCLEPWCVSAPGGDRARLRLQPGVLEETNGLALLDTRGFGDAIAAKADRVFNWLSHYMAHPRDCAGVIAPPAGGLIFKIHK